MLDKIQYLFLALSVFSVFFSASAKAEVKRDADSQINSISKSSQLTEFPKPATTIKEWLSQSPTPSQILITGVRINQVNEGIEVILDTKEAIKLQPTSQSEGNSFIIDIPNAQLRLQDGNTFRQEKPIAGITEVSVINTDANTIRLIVTGDNSLPKVELSDSDEGLIFEVAPASTTPQKPELEKPTSETKPEQPTAESQEPIELVVTGEQDGYRAEEASTATKIEAPIRDIPQSIQVIPRQVIEDRQVVRLNELTDAVLG